MAMYCTAPEPRNPILAKVSRSPAFCVRALPADFAIKPISSPSSAIDKPQPMKTPRVSRIASPVGPVSRLVCGRALLRSAITLAPRSRDLARFTASPAISATSAAIGISMIGCGELRGRSSSIQPSGESQRSQARPVPESAVIRSA